jgi:hypothetical protein
MAPSSLKKLAVFPEPKLNMPLPLVDGRDYWAYETLFARKSTSITKNKYFIEWGLTGYNINAPVECLLCPGLTSHLSRNGYNTTFGITSRCSLCDLRKSYGCDI